MCSLSLSVLPPYLRTQRLRSPSLSTWKCPLATPTGMSLLFMLLLMNCSFVHIMMLTSKDQQAQPVYLDMLMGNTNRNVIPVHFVYCAFSVVDVIGISTESSRGTRL